MKRLQLLLVCLTVFAINANAQRGYIVYTEYEPDTVLNNIQNRFTLDVDFDGEDDLIFKN